MDRTLEVLEPAGPSLDTGPDASSHPEEVT